MVNVHDSQSQQETYYQVDPTYLLPDNLMQTQLNSPVSYDNCLSSDRELSGNSKQLQYSNLNRMSTNTQNVTNSASWSSITTTSNSEVNFHFILIILFIFIFI